MPNTLDSDQHLLFDLIFNLGDSLETLVASERGIIIKKRSQKLDFGRSLKMMITKPANDNVEVLQARGTGGKKTKNQTFVISAASCSAEGNL